MAQRVYNQWPWPPPIINESKLPELNESQALNKEVLMSIYLSRPRQIIAHGLGEWFTNALDLNDPVLSKMESVPAMQYIANAGYDTIPHLAERLSSFNEICTLCV